MPTRTSIPKAIAVHLSSLGSVRDPNARKWHLSAPEPLIEEMNGIPGFFGAINEGTHDIYASVPSPGIAAYSVLYEVSNPQGVVSWQPPANIRPPAADNVIEPNRSLLGYVPRTLQINQEIGNIYAKLGIQADYNANTLDLENIAIGRNFNGIPFCIDLLRHVSTKIRDSRISSIMGAIETEVVSQTQLGYVVTAEPDLPTCDTFLHAIGVPTRYCNRSV